MTGTSVSLLPVDNRVAELAVAHPDRLALVHGTESGEASLTYAELHAAANRCASLLDQLGVRPGDRVAVMAGNGVESPIARLGIARVGAAEVPVNTMYRNAELEFILTDSGATAVMFTSSCTSNLESLSIISSPDRPRLVCLDADDPLADVSLDAGSAAFSGQEWTRLAQPDELAFVSYTSGTTGFPKGALLTHYQCSVAMAMIQATLDLTDDDVVLHALPMFHSNSALFGYLLGWYIGGSSVSIGRFSGPLLADMIERYRVSCAVLVPTILFELNSLSAKQPMDLSSLRYLAFGASPTPPNVREDFQRAYPQLKLLHAYGMTEAPGVVSLDPLDGPPRPGTVGRPFSHLHVRIVDDNDNEVPVGEEGEITLGPARSGPYAGIYRPISGYLNQPEASALATAGGYFHTGDVGYLDTDGFLALVDRKKDMIIASGYNIYPAELERVLVDHPAIAEAYVVGIPDERRVEAPKAYVVVEDGAEISVDEVKAYVRTQLAAYKALADVEFRERDQLPRNAMGKVVKRELA